MSVSRFITDDNIALHSWPRAQPPYVTNVTIARTAHNVVYVATVNHSIYAFAADNEAELWMKNYRLPTSLVPLCHDSAFNTSAYQGAGMIRTGD
jgi:hypothetical protein